MQRRDSDAECGAAGGGEEEAQTSFMHVVTEDRQTVAVTEQDVETESPWRAAGGRRSRAWPD